MFINDFLSVWESFTDGRGFCHPLPTRWQTKVVAGFAAGATADDWWFSVNTAMDKFNEKQIKNTATFSYAQGVLWTMLADRFGHDMQGRAPRLVALRVVED